MVAEAVIYKLKPVEVNEQYTKGTLSWVGMKIVNGVFDRSRDIVPVVDARQRVMFGKVLQFKSFGLNGASQKSHPQQRSRNQKREACESEQQHPLHLAHFAELNAIAFAEPSLVNNFVTTIGLKSREALVQQI